MRLLISPDSNNGCPLFGEFRARPSNLANIQRQRQSGGEICAFGGAPRKTVGVHCFVCVPTVFPTKLPHANCSLPLAPPPSNLANIILQRQSGGKDTIMLAQNRGFCAKKPRQVLKARKTALNKLSFCKIRLASAMARMARFELSSANFICAE